MLKDIKNILKHCKICKKSTHTKSPPKSVISCDYMQLYEQWAINFISPMPKNNQGKQFIITVIDFCIRWLLAVVTSSCDSNYIKRFIGQKLRQNLVILK